MHQEVSPRVFGGIFPRLRLGPDRARFSPMPRRLFPQRMAGLLLVLAAAGPGAALRADSLCAVAGEAGATVITNSPPDGVCRRVVVAGGDGSPSSSSAPAGGTPPLERSVARHARTYGVSQKLVRAVIQAESGGNSAAISPKGAQGVMQLMPATARRFDVANPWDPDQNIEGGVRYLAHLLDLYNGDTTRALAAYNAGEGAVEKYGGVPPYRETRDYVRKVLDLSGGGASRVRRPAGQGPPPSAVRMIQGADGTLRLEN